RPWLMPSRMLAATIQLQVGAQMISRGTGRPISQPATRMGLRPRGRARGRAYYEQDVAGGSPARGGGPDDQQGHGQADQPAGDQDGFAAVAVGQGAGQGAGGRLGEAEGDDVGKGRRQRGYAA